MVSSSGLESPGEGGGVRPVYLRCSQGSVTWLYPRGALRILLRYGTQSKEFQVTHNHPEASGRIASVTLSTLTNRWFRWIAGLFETIRWLFRCQHLRGATPEAPASVQRFRCGSGPTRGEDAAPLLRIAQRPGGALPRSRSYFRLTGSSAEAESPVPLRPPVAPNRFRQRHSRSLARYGIHSYHLALIRQDLLTIPCVFISVFHWPLPIHSLGFNSVHHQQKNSFRIVTHWIFFLSIVDDCPRSRIGPGSLFSLRDDDTISNGRESGRIQSISFHVETPNPFINWLSAYMTYSAIVRFNSFN